MLFAGQVAIESHAGFPEQPSRHLASATESRTQVVASKTICPQSALIPVVGIGAKARAAVTRFAIVLQAA
jgi:hypothetical protein